MSEKTVRTDLVDRVFGRLTVIKLSTRTDRWGRRFWECLCECGQVTTPATSKLTSGATKSCGCLAADRLSEMRHKHGMSQKGDPTYKAWVGMRGRCLSETNQNYKNYGGRGITICSEWVDDYEQFLLDMGTRPGDHLSLDRIDVNGNYEPDNCQWADRKQQGMNRRNVDLYVYGGRTMSLPDLAREFGVSQTMVAQRVRKLGWPVTMAVLIGNRQGRAMEVERD